jgi:lysyl-tRNA synthetase class 2
MTDTENLFEFLALKLFDQPTIPFQGKSISVKTPWPRFRVRDLFLEWVGIDLVQTSTPQKLAQECSRLGLFFAESDSWDDLYFRIWLNRIEPNLPSDQAVFVTRYPSSQAALAVVDSDPDGSRWARRFELYAGGLELGNAFEELTDPLEQRSRFQHDMEFRAKTYGPSFPTNPLDEGFLEALGEGMPPSGGIAVGVDRMVMLYADEPDIEFTTWL